MSESHYPFYDTALLGNAVATHTLFSQSEGSATDKESEDTNMRIGGQFAQGSSFLIQKISTFVDDVLALADVPLIWEQSYMKLVVNNKILLQIPLRLTAEYNAFNGAYSEATASDVQDIGIEGDGFELKIPILVRGGEQIKVEIEQRTALSTTGQRLKMVLDGLLDDEFRG